MTGAWEFPRNPHPRTITDESSGVEVRNPHYDEYQEAMVQGIMTGLQFAWHLVNLPPEQVEQARRLIRAFPTPGRN